MSTFDDREKSYESKFARDEELTFKINARRNKLLGLWAADKLGKKAPEADQYAKEVVMSDFEKEGDQDVVDKLLRDFKTANIAMTEKDIRFEMERLMPVARKQIIEGKK
jgi:hypothetical protein